MRAFHLCELHDGDQKKELLEQLAVSALEDYLKQKSKKIAEAHTKSSGELGARKSAKLQRVSHLYKGHLFLD